MRIFKGKGVTGGIAIGKIYIYKKKAQQIQRVSIEDTAGEARRFTKARKAAANQLQELYSKAAEAIGEADAAIFEMHRMLLEDTNYVKSVESIIYGQKVNAEYAVAATADNLSEVFTSMEDDYISGRGADVKDISERVLHILTGCKASRMLPEEPVIVMADDLSPSETMQMDKDKILAFVTAGGSVHSHTAILARTMDIPALVAARFDWGAIAEGQVAAVDAFNGNLYIEPDAGLLETMRQRQQEEADKRKHLETYKGKETVTLDGKKIKLYANIGNRKDIDMVLQNDAGGIGLFRSEFIYMEEERFPSEEEQFEIYRTVAERMEGKPVVIRTLDMGADKQAACYDFEKEENPAMGYRGIRISLMNPELFKIQLRAIWRAAAYGNISVMYPMITSVGEVREIKAMAEEVIEDLQRQGISYGDVKQGIMIETPAAVMISGELAEEVDFFSIGTNDLTQYALAIDRGNTRLDRFYDVHHPAVLRMIQMTVENAHKAGIEVGICGELAADTGIIGELLQMGMDELSVSPGQVLSVRKAILEWRDVSAPSPKSAPLL